MNEQALLTLGDLADYQALNENDAIELIGKYGIAPGTVMRIPTSATGCEGPLQVHVRMTSEVAAWQLGDVLKLRRLAPPLVLAEVMHLAVLD